MTDRDRQILRAAQPTQVYVVLLSQGQCITEVKGVFSKEANAKAFAESLEGPRRRVQVEAYTIDGGISQ